MERARKAVGWSASRLSDRCRELGVPIHRVALGKMETGERTPTVDELTVIAAALNTSPAMLLFGTDLVEGSVALLPSLRTSADHALQWFSGKSSLTPDAQSAYSQANRPISLARDLETARHMLRHSVNDLAAAISRDDERVQMFREILRRSQDEVEFIESEIRESGLVLNSDDASDT
ncbi:helix-turn-helix domain-containing protein [Mycobacterium sp. SVM_VP21]|nr:helix-turn-helix domain-containing protein [Mycobacterium sp. SVM_VP21]